jgi:hypothetical protein
VETNNLSIDDKSGFALFHFYIKENKGNFKKMRQKRKTTRKEKEIVWNRRCTLKEKENTEKKHTIIF